MQRLLLCDVATKEINFKSTPALLAFKTFGSLRTFALYKDRPVSPPTIITF